MQGGRAAFNGPGALPGPRRVLSHPGRTGGARFGLAGGDGSQIAPEKVLHCCIEPVFRPRVNQFTRCCDVPWVKLSGTA